MGIFSGLEKLGLKKLDDLEVYESETSSVRAEEKKETVQKASVQESDFLFDKTYTCPVCDATFTSRTVKVGKVKTISQDSDLRPRYAYMDALKYDAVVCPRCGFAAIARYFKGTSPSQNKWIKEQISANFRGFQKPGEVYTYDDAITMHKLALMSTIVKRGKNSERAFCCLKLAWLYRGKREECSDEKLRTELKAEEMELLEKAFEGFSTAVSKENFPMCGMDELTLDYLVADLARQLGKYDIAQRWIGSVILSRNANERIKERARDLREQIMHDQEQALAENAGEKN